MNGNGLMRWLCKYVRSIPQAAKPMGIPVENGSANAEDIARVAGDRLFIRIKPR